ncbi:YrzA family protein [Ectobacillus ponti]|uniref:YrzA family protein n=1 Tax=Ectobacillus ponti TaxID=2961894 RepID=A0AA42BNA3_9BACI|nr:YrzA family protein [Ectobacillus ponti]MCP8967256.1 YrzA family protein [Ectobacillus ponti]
MQLSFQLMEDKVEFFEAGSLAVLEKKVNEQIENNKALMLEVRSVSHQVAFDPDSKRPHYSAVVHFTLKKSTR